MRFFLLQPAWLSLAGLCSVLCACSRQEQVVRPQAPVASGTVVQVELGDKAMLRGGEIGSWTPKTFYEGKIEIYPTCIIVTEPNGIRHVAPPERFGMVRFK